MHPEGIKALGATVAEQQRRWVENLMFGKKDELGKKKSHLM